MLAAAWDRLARLNPYAVAGLTFILGLVVSPVLYHHFDVVDCFLNWARASKGSRPWEIYRTEFGTNCDYPPVVPYLLTVVEAARLAVGASPEGAFAITLVKLPNLLAWVAHVPLCALGLRRPFGAPAATVAATLAALSPPLFLNAAAWGQFDALLSLTVVAAVVALLNGRVAAAGAALGLGVATKLLAIVAVPVLGVWIWRRHGPRALAHAVGAALLVMALLAVPHLAGGGGRRMLDAYRGAVDYYPYRTIEAYNGWYLMDRVDIFLRGMPAREARVDTRPLVGPLTHQHLGLLLLAGYTVFLLVCLWRWPTPHGLVLTATMQFFAFFMLPTQMHQRYIVPAAALATLVAAVSPAARALFVGLTITATLNQGLDLGRAILENALISDPLAVASPPTIRATIRIAASAVALANVALFVWATWTLRREMARPPE